MEWETVIGLEVHVQLKTKSKIFSGSSTSFGAEPNTQACAIDLGLPGVLPVLNKEALNMAIKFGIATKAEINQKSIFERKNYFYPDLPKGYQISQADKPTIGKGKLSVTLEDGSEKVINITRAHLEEDAGKSLHGLLENQSLVDLNRAGSPLLEIVSEPEMRSAKEAIAYLKKLHSLVRYLEICDGNMQEGSFRCDANVSVRPMGQKEFGTRCEIKNVNSFKFVEKAINYEVERQIDLISSGGTVKQQTRLYDADKNETRPMREKEEASDYRYFPDPDLLPVIIEDELISRIKQSMPELPDEKRDRFQTEYKISAYNADILTSDKTLANYFEEVLASTNDASLVANWIIGDLMGALNKAGLELSKNPISTAQMAGLINRILDNTISGKIAKQVFEIMFNTGGDADSIIEAQGLKQVTDTKLIEEIIDKVIANSPEQLEQYRNGKDKLFGYFVGQVMQESKGKANPAQVNELLKQKLNK